MFLSLNINLIRNLDFYESNITLINSKYITQACRQKNSTTRFIRKRKFILN